MAPVVTRLRDCNEIISRICITAQHREMLDQVLSVFNITPDYDLNIMRKDQTLAEVTSRVILGMEDVIKDFQPDIILVHGDTTTAFATALSGFYNKISIGHVEAGLRTGNIYSPWPEELNRCLVDKIATHMYAPTETSKDNLLAEGLPSENIIVTGNTVIDALQDALTLINEKPALKKACMDQFDFLDENLKTILVTGHRRENFGEGFLNLCEALSTISLRNDVQIVYPVHLNPNVQEPVNKILGHNKRVHLLEPLEYLEFVYLMNASYLILTDSGGIQEEAPSLGKPVLVTRDVTERPEAVDAGTVKLVGTNKDLIIQNTAALLDNPDLYSSMSTAHNPYGDGKAADRIIGDLIHGV